MRPMFFASIVAVLLSTGTGCVHRELVSFADHESKPLTAMNVSVHRSYLFWSSEEFVFYSCAEQGDKLTCRRLCGGSNDIVCPAAHSGGYGPETTNVR